MTIKKDYSNGPLHKKKAYSNGPMTKKKVYSNGPMAKKKAYSKRTTLYIELMTTVGTVKTLHML